MNNESLLGNKGVTGNSDTSTAVSSIVYEIENGQFRNMSQNNIIYNIEKMKSTREFPSHLTMIDSFYDEETSLSGVAFKDTNTGEVTVGFAGTNMDNGTGETMKDVQTNLEIGMTGLSFEERLKPIETFMDGLYAEGYNITESTGHSLGGNLAGMVALMYDIELAVIYNAAPLSVDNEIAGGLLAAALGGNNNNERLSSVISAGVKRNINGETIEELYQNYSGNFVHFRTDNDILNTAMRLPIVDGRYYGDEYILYNGAGHGIAEYNSEYAQKIVQYILSLERESTKRKGLEIDFTNNGKPDLILQSEQLLKINLLNGELLSSKATGSELIEIEQDHLQQLAAGLSGIANEDLNWIEQAINYCVEDNESVSGDYQLRVDQFSEAFVEALREASFFKLLEDLEASFGKLEEKTTTLRTISSFKINSVTRKFNGWFRSGQYNWFADRMPWEESSFRRCANNLIQSSQVLAHQISTDGVLIYNDYHSGKKILEYDTYSKITEAFVVATNNIEPALKHTFEGEGLRVGKQDGIAESLTTVFEAQKQNVKELKQKTNNLKQIVISTALNFEEMDTDLSRQIEQREMGKNRASISVPNTYKEYLEKSDIFDDVHEMLEAFEKQVEQRSEELGGEIANKYSEIIDRVSSKGEEILGQIYTFKTAVEDMDEWLEKHMTAEPIIVSTAIDTTNEEMVREDHGMLKSHFPMDIVDAIRDAKKHIVPLIESFELAVATAGIFQTESNNIHQHLKANTKEAIYRSMEMDDIQLTQQGIGEILERIIAELNEVNDQLSNQASGKGFEAMSNEILALSRSMVFFSQNIDDYFGIKV